MELGNNEMSQKIRSAIKARLVELGSYVDDELPDYIMVMIANKKSQEQMTDDLLLFLGNNTVTFTTWLHGVLEKLSKPATDSKPKKTKEHSVKTKKTKEKRSAASLGQKQAKRNETVIKPVEETAVTTVSAAAPTVLPPAPQHPTVEPVKSAKQEPSQDIISIKPETNDFLDEELALATESAKKQSAVVSPIAEGKKAEQAQKSKPAQKKSLDEVHAPIPSHPTVSVKVSPTFSISRKRKAPGSVIGQVLNVEEEEDSDEGVSFGKKVASTVLPQRRPSLPVRKQANTSLLKKAVSAAEASTSQVLTAQLTQEKTKIPHKRFRIIRRLQPLPPKRNLLLKAVQEAKDSISLTRPQSQPPAQVEIMPKFGLVSRSRILEITERDYDSQEFMKVSSDPAQQVEEYYADDEEQDETESSDSRHICVASETSPSQVVYLIDDENTDKRIAEPVYTPTPLVAPSKSESHQRPVSPKFIVTLEGTSETKSGATKQRKAARVAPRLSLTRTIDNSMMYADFVEQQQQLELEDELARQKQQEDLVLQREIMLQQQQKQEEQQLKQRLAREESINREELAMLITRKPHVDQVEEMEFEEEEYEQEEDVSPSKKEPSSKERCMFWPACKNGSDCLYVHPTTPCRTFPKCKFGDKCLFIHPNCKYDSRCSRRNCPYTHATRKGGQPSAFNPPPVTLKPLPVYVPPPVVKVCKFHPNCTNKQCPFQHPKICLFGRGCTRPGCPFTHPQVATGAALKWTKQAHISDRPFAAKETTS